MKVTTQARSSLRGAAVVFASVVALAALVALAPRARSAPRAPVIVNPARSLPAEGGLGWDVRDAKTNELIPCKLTLIGAAGTPDPQLTKVDVGREEGDALVAYDRIMSIKGTGAVHVPVGAYDVTVSRGPEWDIATVRVKVGGAGAFVKARLSHVVGTSGWISADFHVHAARSPDSRVPMQDRIYEFVADDVQMIVSTDHNVVSDYEPFIRELDAGRFITSAIGDEMTTASWGHFGAFPLPPDLERAGQGAILVHGRKPSDFFQDVRTNAPGAIIDVHHPRIDNEIGYFDIAKFDARGDRADRPGFSWDFDAVEVMNGYQDPVRRSVDRVVEDWFALLDHEHLVTATGNSDTHHLNFNIGGYPRNYVKVQDDRPNLVDGKQVARALKGHHAFFTTGPFVSLLVNNGTIGDLVPAKGGKARVEITVQAAPWVSVDRVTLLLNGHEEKKWTVAADAKTLPRFHEVAEISSPRDGYVVVRVDGDKPLTPVVGDRKTFTAYPFALTNPVFLDVDGDGRYRTGERHGHP
ncbi:MAG TPA: CehA/McbA family metallohydrolase [Polyangia bacterium]|nr:CehA/McbA family metallohydrolase [Polyangia bacterium]